jgi:uncharacterized phage-associated protein
MLPRFDERKTTQLVAHLLDQGGGSMAYLKLLKLLYIIDREALKRWSWPVTGDHYVSMRRGPVLSITYNLIKGKAAPGFRDYWSRYISEPTDHAVSLLDAAPYPEDLSEAELELATYVYERFKDVDRWKLSDLTHLLPEWQDPGDSSMPIELGDMLRGMGKTTEECRDILVEIEAWGYEQSLLSAEDAS